MRTTSATQKPPISPSTIEPPGKNSTPQGIDSSSTLARSAPPQASFSFCDIFTWIWEWLSNLFASSQNNVGGGRFVPGAGQTLTEFYIDNLDPSTPTFRFIMVQSDEWLNGVEQHNYIQWVFPSPVPSRAQPGSPVLDEAFKEAFQNSPQIRQNYHSMLERMLRFYGLRIKGNQILRSPLWNVRYPCWININDHNFLRLSRILHSMKALEYRPDLREALHQRLIDIAQNEGQGIISEETLGYWQNAANH